MGYTREQLQGVASIGECLASPTPHAVVEALPLVGRVARADAVMVLAWEPGRSEHRLVASLGYERDLLEYVPAGMMDDDLYGVVRQAGRALCIDTADAPIDFRATHHFIDHLRPAGFHDGMSCPLVVDGGRYVGMVHLNADRSVFGEPERDLVDVLAPMLGRACERGLRELPPGAVVAIDVHGRRLPHPVSDLLEPGAHPPWLADCARRLLIGPATQAELLAHHDGVWHQIRLVRTEARPESPVVLCGFQSVEPAHGLTAREVTILTGIAVGLSNAAIAHALMVSPRTVSTHVERILAKLDCDTRAAAAAIAVRDGLLDPGETALRGLVLDLLFGRLPRGPLAP